jgi:hypothetical protein
VVNVAEDAVGGVGSSSPQSVAATVEEVLVPGQPSAAPQERVTPEGTTRAASPEIQEAEEGTSIALSQGTTSDEAQALELARTPWVAAFEADDNTKDDEEAAACNTIVRGLERARRAFDELILPSTSVNFVA